MISMYSIIIYYIWNNFIQYIDKCKVIANRSIMISAVFTKNVFNVNMYLGMLLISRVALLSKKVYT